MLPSRRQSILRATAALLALWLAVVVLMWIRYSPANLDPAELRYGRDWPGDLQSLIRTSAVEILVLWILLPPWTRTPLWLRLLGVAAIGAPYVGLRMVAGMHGGPITAVHDFWLLLIWLVMLLAVPVTAWRGRRARRP